MNDSSFAQTNWCQPKTILSTKELPVIPGETLIVGLVMSGTNASHYTSTAFVCHIQIFDDRGKLIDERYPGTLHSDKSKNLIFIPSSADAHKACWSSQQVVVPKEGRLAVLQLHAANLFDAKVRSEILCVNIARRPIADRILDIHPRRVYCLNLAFLIPKNRKKIAIVNMTFFDQNSRSIKEEVPGLSYSLRYGYFKYINCDRTGNGSRVVFIPPARSVYVYIQIHSLIADDVLELSAPIEIQIEHDLTRALNEPGWKLVNDNSVLIDTLVSNTSKETRTTYAVRIGYINAIESKTISANIALCSPQMQNATQNSFFCENLYGTDLTFAEKYVILSFPLNHKKLKYSSIGGSFGFIYKYLSIQPACAISSSSRIQVNQKEPLSKEFEISPFWDGIIEIEVSKRIATQWSITYKTHDNKIIDQITGWLGTESTTSSPAFSHSTLSETTSRDLYNVDLTPPHNATKCVFTIFAPETLDPVFISYEIFPFVRPKNDVNVSYPRASNDQTLQHTGLSKCYAHSLLDPVNRYPKSVNAYMVSLLFLAKSGYTKQCYLLANKIIQSFRDRTACKLARNILALLKTLDSNWFPTTSLVSKSKGLNSTVGKVNVAILQDWDTYLPRIYCADFQSETQQKFCISVIKPIGYKGSKASALFETETKDGIKYHYTNCVSSEEFRIVPFDSKLEFSVLVISAILHKEKTHALHVIVGKNGLNQALLGIGLAQQHAVPLLFEIQDFPYLFFLESEDVVESVFEKHVYSKFMFCLQKADAIIVYSEELRTKLITNGVSEDKIFLSNFPALSEDRIDAKSNRFTANSDLIKEVYQFAYTGYYAKAIDKQSENQNHSKVITSAKTV